MMEYVLFQKVECSVEVSAIQLHHSHKTDWCGPFKAGATQRPVCILFHFVSSTQLSRNSKMFCFQWVLESLWKLTKEKEGDDDL